MGLGVHPEGFPDGFTVGVAAGLALQLQSCLEGQQLGVEVVAGINIVLAIGIVSLTACLSGAVAGEVLDDGVQGVLTPAQVFAVLIEGRLEAVDIGLRHVYGQLGILSEGSGDPAPAGLRTWMQLSSRQG